MAREIYTLPTALNTPFARVDGEGNIITIAGTGKRGFSGDGGPAIRSPVLLTYRYCR